MSAASFRTATIDVKTLERLITVIQTTGETGRAEAENAAADNLQACSGLSAAGPRRLQLCTRALVQIVDAAEEALPSGTAAGWAGQVKSDVEQARTAIRRSTTPPSTRGKACDAIPGPGIGTRASRQTCPSVYDAPGTGTGTTSAGPAASQVTEDPGGQP